METLTPIAKEHKPITQEQRQALENADPVLLLWGPGYSGKTEIGALKALAVAIKHPGTVIFLIRRQKVTLRHTLWNRFTKIMTASLPRRAYTKWDDQQMIITLSNGSEIYGLGLDSITDVNKLAGTQCGVAVVEECTEIPEEYFDEKIMRSCRLPDTDFHQVLLMCNPAAPSHWVNQRFLIPQNQKYANIYMPTLPKKYIPAHWYLYLQNLTGVFAQRYREGKWVAVEGLVWSFNPQKHILPRFNIPRNWEKIMSVDFGFDLYHPFCCQWWAITPEEFNLGGRIFPANTHFCYRQIYKSNTRVAIHADNMMTWCKRDGLENYMFGEPTVICDHDADNMADLRAAGFKTIPARKERLAGQQSVQRALETDQMFYLEDSVVEIDQQRLMQKLPTRTEDEFALYIWANKGKEDMIKENDDGMDATRYFEHTLKFIYHPRSARPKEGYQGDDIGTLVLQHMIAESKKKEEWRKGLRIPWLNA